VAVDLEPPWVDTRYGSICYGPQGLPALTIGPQQIEWGMTHLTIPNGELVGQPWVPTYEQARFICWWNALDPTAARRRRPRWLYRRAALRRLKGGGKDPLAAYLCLQNLIGPSVPVWDAQQGRFVGVPHRSPWIQVAAVSQSQTRTTGTLFSGMLPARTRRKFRLTVAATIVHSPLGRIESMTSSPLAAEGPRPNLSVVVEPQNWFESNGGHAMYAVMRRNAAKVGGRLLEIGNAPEQGADSVSERTERAYNAWRAGKATSPLRLLYDSREAPPEARLDDLVLRRAGLRAAIGDAWWIDPEDIETEIGSLDVTPSQSRRYYFNRSNAADDAWCDPDDWDRLGTGFGIASGREVVVFADLSKSRDATAMIAVDLETGHVATIDVWARPDDHRRENWQVPRAEVLQAGLGAMSRWRVVAFFADPGSGEDDEGKKYWDAVIDAWARQLDADAMPATPTGALPHRVRWDMRDPKHVRQFTAAAERTSSDIEDGLLTHDSHPLLNQHVYSSKLRPNDYGVSMGKEHRESSFHVDAGVAMVGARMMRIQYYEWRRNRRVKRPGVVSGIRVG
jgi:hypothetical protein